MALKNMKDKFLPFGLDFFSNDGVADKKKLLNHSWTYLHKMGGLHHCRTQ